MLWTYGRPVAVKRWSSAGLEAGTRRAASSDAMDAVSGFAILAVVDMFDVVGATKCNCEQCKLLVCERLGIRKYCYSDCTDYIVQAP